MARTTIATPGFLDRLGDRVIVSDRAGGDLEVLRLRPELTADPAFESGLKSRAEELTAFQHRGVSRVRGISRLPAPDGRLAVVSESVRGWRLSEVLQAAEQEEHLVHTSTVLFLLRQVASACAALQAAGAGIAHGALGPERVILTPDRRVFVVEYVLGAALDHLPAHTADRMWKDLRLAVPGDEAGPRFGPHTDVLQLGVIALSLVHNRLLRRDEYPGRLAELLDSATESLLTGARQPIGASLRRWLEDVLGLRRETANWTMEDAQRGLDWIVSKEGGYFSTPVGFEPLMQSVDRFFNVPAADSSKPDSAPAIAAPETPAKPSPVIEPRSSAKPSSGPSPTVMIAAASAAPRRQPDAETPSSTTSKGSGGLRRTFEPNQTVMVAAASIAPRRQAEAEPADRPATKNPPSSPRSVAPAPSAPSMPAVEVKTAAPAALPAPAAPVAALPAATASSRAASQDAEKPPIHAALRQPFAAPGDPEIPAESLLTNASPLAEFAAERATDPLPGAPEAATPSSARPALRPLPPPRPTPPPPPADPEQEVGPVADMLAAGGNLGTRRSGWNDQAWMSRSGARATAGRSPSPGSGGVPKAVKSGPAPAATPLRSRESAAAPVPSVPEPTGTPAPPQPAKSPASGSASREARAWQAPAKPMAPAPASSRPSGEHASASVASRSMFGAAASEPPEEATSGGSKAKWLAIAAVLILAAGGFAGWKLLGPSKPAASAQTAESTKPAPAATQPSEAAQAPAAAPAPSTANVPPAPAETAPVQPQVNGFAQVVSAIPVRVSERGESLGTSASALPLAPGRHVLDLANEEVGYHASVITEIRSGRTSRVAVALPRGSVNINATPWAEVFVDGQRLGETPLGNVQLVVGSHEVRFKHPQLGEQVRTVVVTTGAPGRLSVDMKQ